VLALGGHFRRDGLLDGVQRMLEREGIAAVRGEAPPHLVFATGAAFAGAEDGTLVLASSPEVLRGALPSKAPSVQLTRGVALSYVAVGSKGEGSDVAASGALGGARVDIRAGTPFPFVAHLVPGSASLDGESARRVLSGETGDFPLLGRLEAPVQVQLEAGEVTAQGTISRPEMAHIIGRLSERFRALSMP